MERYQRKDGLVSLTIKFFYRGHCYRRGLGPVTLKQYRLEEKRARIEAAEGTFYKPPGVPVIPTLATFAPQFLDSYRTDARPSSVENYASRIDKHLQVWLGSLRLDQITPHVLDLYRSQRHTEGAAPRTINAELACLSAILTKAVLWGILPPAMRAKVTWVKTEERTVRVLSPIEEGRLLLAATARLRPLIRFALQTGLRRGELTRLTWDDIDWTRREVVVIGIRAKSRKRRAIPLNHAAITVLRELQGQPGKYGRVFGYKSLRSPFLRATQKAGLVGVSCHTLRRTWATRLLETDPPINIRTLQKWLGHASLVTTEKYLHSSEAYEREAIERLGDGASQHRR